MKAICFLALSILLAACSPSKQPDVEKIKTKAFQEGYSQALDEINLENLQNLKGHMIACKALSPLPTAAQGLAGLDCTMPFDKYQDINNIAANIPYRTIFAVLIMAISLVILLVTSALTLRMLIEALGGISGQFNASLIARSAKWREAETIKIKIEAEELRNQQIAPLYEEVEQLKTTKESIQNEIRFLENEHQKTDAELDKVQSKLDELKKHLEKQLALSKAADSTENIANILSSLGKKGK